MTEINIKPLAYALANKLWESVQDETKLDSAAIKEDWVLEIHGGLDNLRFAVEVECAERQARQSNQSSTVKGLGGQVYSIELRDIFAGQALAAMERANPGCWEDLSMSEQAFCCYQMADAMLEARVRK